MKALALLSPLFLIMISCGVQRQPENYQLEGIADLNLTAVNHPHGYTRTECFVCHLPQNIHLVDHLGAPSFGLARPLVEAQGLLSCRGCHGSNGLTP